MEKTAFGIRMEKKLLADVDKFASTQGQSRSMAIERLTATGLVAVQSKKVPYQDNQDQESGAAAAQWGRKTGPRIAQYFGGEQVKPNVNEFIFDGDLVAIKVASPTNTQIGVYNTVRDRVSAIWGAFQTKDDTFEIFQMTPKSWKELAREAAKSNPNYGKLTFVNVSSFRKHGQEVAVVKMADLAAV